MHIEILENDRLAAEFAADLIAARLRARIDERGFATIAFSGGSTPAVMLHCFSRQNLDWTSLHVFQVDERIVLRGDAQRNLDALQDALGATGLPPDHLHAMPVDQHDISAAAREYAKALQVDAASPAQLDVVHLGLGNDGHTASLVPGDAGIDSIEAVTVTAPYKGTRRMTLTLPVLNEAGMRVWLVTGHEKRAVLRRLFERDPDIIAARVNYENSTLVADRDAAADWS
jgi:6-phosphogluconolactonase